LNLLKNINDVKGKKNDHRMMVGTRVFAFGEDTPRLPLTSELDALCAWYANPILARWARSWARSRGYAAIKNAPLDLRGAFFMARGYEKDIF
jgi:hypothetical protein